MIQKIMNKKMAAKRRKSPCRRPLLKQLYCFFREIAGVVWIKRLYPKVARRKNCAVDICSLDCYDESVYLHEKQYTYTISDYRKGESGFG